MKFPKLNKKGDIASILFVIIILFVLGYVYITTFVVWQPLKAVVEDLETVEGDLVISNVNTVVSNMDFLFGFAIIALFIGVIVSSFLIDSHPIFLPITLVFLAVVVFLSASLSNIFFDTTQNASVTDAVFLNASASFPITTIIMNNLPIWIALVGGLSIIVLIAKFRIAVGG